MITGHQKLVYNDVNQVEPVVNQWSFFQPPKGSGPVSEFH